MKSKSSTLKTFAGKALIIFTCTIICLFNFIACNAQSFAGKWKEVSGKDYCTAKGAKATGKQFLPQAPQGGGQVLEIKSDHTFTSSELMSWIPSSMHLTGTWTLAGNQLTTKLDMNQKDPLNNPTKEAATTVYTLTMNGDNMILSLLINNNPIIARMEKTYTKM